MGDVLVPSRSKHDRYTHALASPSHTRRSAVRRMHDIMWYSSPCNASELTVQATYSRRFPAHSSSHKPVLENSTEKCQFSWCSTCTSALAKALSSRRPLMYACVRAKHDRHCEVCALQLAAKPGVARRGSAAEWPAGSGACGRTIQRGRGRAVMRVKVQDCVGQRRYESINQP